ncbi:hypothetical protein [Mycoplasmopsis opalescens]|uniref:hypothetical protein n=1 Tax=Mycoplasmopsis opalescens TaxID=114886 RepID=UPI0004A751E4|nr:hypothetical protein [Mycoplasmopsis opalescens]
MNNKRRNILIAISSASIVALVAGATVLSVTLISSHDKKQMAKVKEKVKSIINKIKDEAVRKSLLDDLEKTTDKQKIVEIKNKADNQIKKEKQ